MEILLGSGWDGSPACIPGLAPWENEWIRTLEEHGVADAVFLDEPPGWRLVIRDEQRFCELLPELKEYGVYGICRWVYDIR